MECCHVLGDYFGTSYTYTTVDQYESYFPSTFKELLGWVNCLWRSTLTLFVELEVVRKRRQQPFENHFPFCNCKMVLCDEFVIRFAFAPFNNFAIYFFLSSSLSFSLSLSLSVLVVLTIFLLFLSQLILPYNVRSWVWIHVPKNS